MVRLDPMSLDPEPTVDREALESVFADHLSEAAVRAAALLSGGWSLALPDESAHLDLPVFADAADAGNWMAANTEALVSCARGARESRNHLTVCRIAESLEVHLRGTGRSSELVELLRSASASARDLEDTAWEARTRNLLGLSLLETGELAGADREFETALALADTDEDDRGRATALEGRGIVAQRDRRDDEALALFERVRPLKEALKWTHGIAVLDLLAGRSLLNSGRFEHAMERLDAAMAVFDATGEDAVPDEVNAAKVRSERGRALIAARRFVDAREELYGAREGFEKHDQVSPSARVCELLAGLGQLNREDGWRRHLVEAERLYERIGDTAAVERVRRHL